MYLTENNLLRSINIFFFLTIPKYSLYLNVLKKLKKPFLNNKNI